MSDAESLTREYFGAVGAGDRERLAAVMADDVEYRFPGRSTFASTYRGKEQVLSYLDRLRAFTGGSMNVTVNDVLTGSRRCAGWVRAEAQHNGASFAWDLVALIETSDSAIKSITLFYDNQYGVDQFLGAA
jgi:ketosteroid isomerase-like protein